MKKEEIKRLVREAEIPVEITGGNPTWEKIERFAALVAAAEREACAKVAETMLRHYTQAVTGVAEAIRARGQE